MARAYSAEYKSTLAGVSAPEAPLVLLEIDHPDLVAPVRILTPDNLDLVSNGDTYTAAPVRVELPDDFDQQLPGARLAVDNIGRELMTWIEASAGGAGSTCRFMQVMRSRPDQIEWEITMSLHNLRATMREVSAGLGFENLFNRPACQLYYRPDVAPGVF